LRILFQIRWTIFGLNILSWVFSVVTLSSCEFLIIGATSSRFGLFKGDTNDDGQCFKYAEVLGGAHGAGRAFGVLANLCLVFAFVGISLVIFLLKEKPARIAWLATRILYVCALLWVLLTFSFLASINVCEVDEAECGLGPGGSINVVNVFILIGIVSTGWITPIPPDPVIKSFAISFQGGAPPAHNNETKQENYTTPSSHSNPTAAPQVTKTIEITANGRKITEEVTHPDGTKTVTETFEEATEGDEESQQSYRPQQSSYQEETYDKKQHYLPPIQASHFSGGGKDPSGIVDPEK